MLSLDLPPIALFKNENKDMVVQQIPLYTLLDKYNGEKATKVRIREMNTFVSLFTYVFDVSCSQLVSHC